jgi:hypothetical protein
VYLRYGIPEPPVNCGSKCSKNRERLCVRRTPSLASEREGGCTCSSIGLPFTERVPSRKETLRIRMLRSNSNLANRSLSASERQSRRLANTKSLCPNLSCSSLIILSKVFPVVTSSSTYTIREALLNRL